MFKFFQNLVNTIISNPTITELETKVLDKYEELGKPKAQCKTSTDKPGVAQSESV